MSKVMILTASTGGGHNSAARAIATAFKEEGCEGVIIDGIRTVSPLLDKIISEGYENSAKYTPRTYGKLYKLTDTPYLNQEHATIINSLLKNKIKQLIDEHKPDLIVGTHPFPLMAAARLKEIGKIDIPIMAVLTDYTTHASWVKPGIDAYVVAADDLKYLLEEEGADISQVYPFGIPVNPDFLKPRDLDKVRQELKLKDKFTILLMGGSFGAGNMKDFLCELAELKGDFQIVAVTGRNSALKEKLDQVVKKRDLEENVRVLGYTRLVSELMSIANVLVTKPGGLTTTEALLKQIPIVIPFFIPGQEEENVDFLLNHGLAFKTSRKYSLKIIVQSLMDNPERLKEMSERMRRYAKPNAARDLAQLGIKMIKSKGIVANSV
ncbi:hypothetical protein BBF96_00535 [Anoxybacter fermentans]|uniref:Galactosyldiacylglycerol synthase n=1 Tax=Anoxybacter fermentans TaxID=1323375 RepID=A0A3Q9HNN8_9FIRM|nr:glycosyltransferase [Anoxybacter fermentans]AZR72023.1 hypothetical protein BBF96_00535 [Anoxybacter fermentans]